ncbi:hypothetical protein [Embleya hyalina]|uniref:hypothetical protein n=1 Tax=Embleya hyalina TaxID=516124 RepID=UPI0014769374|nr:hypothetical protein [Embleya hyalina]
MPVPVPVPVPVTTATAMAMAMVTTAMAMVPAGVLGASWSFSLGVKWAEQPHYCDTRLESLDNAPKIRSSSRSFVMVRELAGRRMSGVLTGLSYAA